MLNRTKTYVINAFASSDLDGNGECTLEEFLILVKHIEPEAYEEFEVLNLVFMENAVANKDGELILTFEKFAIICVEYQLFSEETQDRFLNLKHKSELYA